MKGILNIVNSKKLGIKTFEKFMIYVFMVVVSIALLISFIINIKKLVT